MKKRRFLPKKKKTTIVLAVAAVAVIASGGWFLLSGNAAPEGEEQSQVQEATAARGDIRNTIVGTGNLTTDAADQILIPSGLVIDSIEVESGTSVSKGDILARVNETSILSAINSVQEEIETLDDKINTAQEESETQTLESKVAGRVKKIYAETGNDARSCIAEFGALMVLSIDGRMAVDFEPDGETVPGVGDSVEVSDGDTVYNGTVTQSSASSCTVTFSDKGTEPEAEVTVSDEAGTKIGSGMAYINQQLKITSTGGEIAAVKVSENQKVSSGTALLTLEQNDQTAEFKEQTARRATLEAELQKLIKMEENPVITADRDGIISEIHISESSSGTTAETDAGTSSGGIGGAVQATRTSYQTGSSGAAFTMLAAVSDEQGGEAAGEPDTASEETESETVGQPETESDSEAAAVKIVLQVRDSGASGRDTLVIQAPSAGAIPQTEIQAVNGVYSGAISWQPAAEIFAGETVYEAVVTLRAETGYYFDNQSIAAVQSGVLSGVAVAADGREISFRITYPQTGKAADQQPDKEQPDKESEQPQSETETTDSPPSGGNTGSGTPSGGGTAAVQGSVQSSAGTADTNTQESQSDNLDSAYSEVAAFSIASEENILLSVSVDELDINSVAVGQAAEITLDALEDQTFSGTVITVGNSASSTGQGVAKYTVEISLPKDAAMKAGMNASATIVVEEKEQVLTIPVNALQERGGRTFVYTQQDSEGNLSGETEITTGLSDGTTVEVTEGLTEGQTVYYQRTGNIGSGGMSGFMGMDRQGGSGQRPDFDGGDMPSGFPGQGEMPSGFPGQGGM